MCRCCVVKWDYGVVSHLVLVFACQIWLPVVPEICYVYPHHMQQMWQRAWCRKFLRVCKTAAANVAAICSTRASFQARCAPAMLVLHKPQQLVHPASTHRSIVLQRLLSQCKGPAMEDLAFVYFLLQHSIACTYYEHHCKHMGSMFHVAIWTFQIINLESFLASFGINFWIILD